MMLIMMRFYRSGTEVAVYRKLLRIECRFHTGRQFMTRFARACILAAALAVGAAGGTGSAAATEVVFGDLSPSSYGVCSHKGGDPGIVCDSLQFTASRVT